MMTEDDMRLRGSEKTRYHQIKDRGVKLPRHITPALLQRTGMDVEFATIFHEVGWENFCEIDEPGCVLLTFQFLCSLQMFSYKVTFKLFSRDFSLTWKQLSSYLGFRDECVVDIDSVIPDFSRESFWAEISGERGVDHPHVDAIELPTFRFIHLWMAISMFPRKDTRFVRIEEMKLMLCMIRRIKVSPVQFMMDHWL